MAIRKIEIPRRRSLLLYAALALAMTFASYVFTLLLALACVGLPLLALVRLPNFQTLLLSVGGAIIACVMLWSLVPRVQKWQAPGPLLEAKAHPLLFTEIEKIASSLGEPVPREVYLVAEANAWVADRGGWMGIHSRRIMGLGLPLMAALNLSQFRAILTHEFAHYYSGDTGLGPWVHRAQMAMARSLQGLAKIGRHRWPGLISVLLVVVLTVLNRYWLLFLRGINFVSRRQEYRADELACILNGRRSLADGLRRTHVAGWLWSSYWKNEVLPMLGAGCLPPIATGFSQFLAVPHVAYGASVALENEIRNGKGGDYDSHPPLRDRLSALESLATLNQPDNNEPALNLLNDVDVQEGHLLQSKNPELPVNGLRRVSWEEQANAILIPSWRATVAEYAHLLKDATPANLPEALAKVSDVAPHIRDPKGLLLTPEQRCERARGLLAMAFALALVEAGWQLHSSPGNLYLVCGDQQLDPWQLFQQISTGKITNDEWLSRCEALGIATLQFAPLPAGGASKAAAATTAE